MIWGLLQTKMLMKYSDLYSLYSSEIWYLVFYCVSKESSADFFIHLIQLDSICFQYSPAISHFFPVEWSVNFIVDYLDPLCFVLVSSLFIKCIVHFSITNSIPISRKKVLTFGMKLFSLFFFFFCFWIYIFRSSISMRLLVLEIYIYCKVVIIRSWIFSFLW